MRATETGSERPTGTAGSGLPLPIEVLQLPVEDRRPLDGRLLRQGVKFIRRQRRKTGVADKIDGGDAENWFGQDFRPLKADQILG